jgi:SulP family sulfate permease
MLGGHVPAKPPHIDPQVWAAPPPPLLRRLVPIVAWLPAYDRRWLRADVIAGATLWGLLVPEMIAYAGLAGLPPQAGLYTLLVTLAAYAIFGTSRHVVVAGTSAAAVLLASAVGNRHPADAAEYASLAAALVLLCGGLFLLGGLLRAGFIAQFLSRPIIRGFVFGLALFVIVSQLPTLLGIAKGSGNTINQLLSVLEHLGDADPATLAVGAGALALLIGADRAPRRLPGGLIVLVAGIVLSAALSLSEHGVAVVGTLPQGLPSPRVPDVHAHDVAPLVAVAAGMVLVMLGETLAAAQTYATEHGYEINADQEMVALGVANLGSGLVGGLAAAGSLSQTAVNEGAGARSEASPLVAAALAVVTVVALTPVFEHLPEAVLAALIIHAVSHLLPVRTFHRYFEERPPEFWLGLATMGGVVTLGVLPGLVIGVTSMLVLFVYQASRPHLAVLGAVPGVPGAYRDVEGHPEYAQVPGLLLLRLEAPLFYANAAMIRDHVKRLVGAAEPTPRAVILDLGANGQLDITSAEVLVDLATTLRGAGVGLVLADVRSRVANTARIAGVTEAVGADHVFHTLDDAVIRMR